MLSPHISYSENIQSVETRTTKLSKMRCFLLVVVLVVAVALAVPASSTRRSPTQGRSGDARQQAPATPAADSESEDSSTEMATKVRECKIILQQAGASTETEKSTEEKTENETEEPKEMGTTMNSRKNNRKY